MPTSFPDDPSQYPTEIFVPVGGEPRTDVSIQGPFRSLANRTANLKARLDAIAPITRPGVTALAHVVSDAALIALRGSDHPDKAICLVDDVGLYEFDAGSSVTPSAPWVRQPTDIPSASTGRWILLGAGYGVVGAPGGLPQCDATGRVPGGAVRNGTLSIASWALGPAGLTLPVTAGLLADIPGSQQSLGNLLPADNVLAVLAGGVATTGGTTLRAVVVQPDGSLMPINGCTASVTASGVVAGVGQFLATQLGAHAIKLQVLASVTGTVQSSTLSHLAVVLRP